MDGFFVLSQRAPLHLFVANVTSDHIWCFEVYYFDVLVHTSFCRELALAVRTFEIFVLIVNGANMGLEHLLGRQTTPTLIAFCRLCRVMAFSDVIVS
jgi:hypothetical protein